MADAVVGAIVGAVAAGIITYWVMRRLYQEQLPTKKLRCKSSCCDTLLSNSASLHGDTVEVRVGGEALSVPVLICYEIESIGNQPITNCIVQVHAAKADQIASHEVLLHNELHCERITFEEETSQKLKFRIAHINPRDRIIVALVVAPCANARCVNLEVDAEGIEVEYKPMFVDCSLTLPEPLHSANKPGR